MFNVMVPLKGPVFIIFTTNRKEACNICFVFVLSVGFFKYPKLWGCFLFASLLYNSKKVGLVT